MNVVSLQDAAEVALAAYGNFIGPGQPDIRALANLNGDDAGFALRQAVRFASRFDVALPTFSDAASLGGTGTTSFDATVFVGKNSESETANNKEIHIALRGTQQRSGSPNDLSASLGIVMEGAAIEQIVAMHNWYRRISGAPGESVAQFGVTYLTTFETVPPGYVFIRNDAQGGHYLYRKTNAAATGEMHPFLLADPDGKVTVSGSSLGGHLAMAFAALFPEQTSQAYAFNSPGFNDLPGVNRLFSALTASRPLSGNSLITNIVSSEANNAGGSLELIAGKWGYPGQLITVPIENQFLSDVSDPKVLSWNHDQRQVTDALALRQLMQGLVPSITFADQNTLSRSSASGETRSIENLVDGLEVLLGLGSTTLAAGNNAEARSGLHAAMQDLQANPTYKALAGKVRLEPEHDWHAARNDVAALLSLVLGLPFSMRLIDSSPTSEASQTLYLQHRTIYEQWLSDRSAAAIGVHASQLTFSDSYLQDRAALLGAMIVRNERNNQGVLTAANAGPAFANGVIYEDVSSATVIRTGVLDDPQRQRVLFGRAAAEIQAGAGLADRLYGGTGNDTLNGLGGNDRLEGNGDNDVLIGGAGADTLFGGTGNDALDGGIDNDLLHGGQDLDTYTFNPGWGHDTVDDSDGKGSIVVTGLGTLTGLGTVKVGENVWQTADKKLNFTLVTVSASRKDLYLTFSDRIDVITLRNWSEAQNLGITLGTTLAPLPTPAATYTGDFSKQLTGTTYAWVGGNYVSSGVQANAADVITGSASGDKLSGLGGNDALAGMQGDDQIDGGIGNDVLLGGAGSDILRGGDGMDFIFGAGVGGLTYPLSTLAIPPSAEGLEIARGFDWVAYEGGVDGNGIPMIVLKGLDGRSVTDDAGNLIDGGVGNDLISGGPGRDTVTGGADDDDIDGLGEADILFGDGGNDTISGDGIALPGYWSTVAGEQHGDDLIDGGAGNDSLEGQGGSDQVYGGIGNDSLWGDDLDARVTPYAWHGADSLDGGDGDDKVVGGGSNDSLSGGQGNDELFGDSSLDKLPGEHHGSDVLDGGNGNDYLEGGGRDDRLMGGAGDDMLWGDAALPGLTATEIGADMLDGGEGADVLVGGGKSDTLYGGGGKDLLTGDGLQGSASDQGDDLLDGGADDDTLEGDGGADQLYGGAGNDWLQGGAGNDTLVGGAGTDVLQGGDGDDTYVVRVDDLPLDAAGRAEYIDDTQGINIVRIEGISPEDMNIMAISGGNLQLRATNGNTLAVLNGAGGSIAGYDFDGMERLRADQLVGRYAASAVITTGADGRQQAVGGKGNDQLTVTSGNAVLSGGRGNDSLEGSGGNNTYRYEIGDGSDTITDSSAKTSANGAPAPNRLVFGQGIMVADLRLTNSGGVGGLGIEVGGDPSQAVRLGGFDAGSATAPSIDAFVLGDGSTLSYAQLVARGFDGTEGDDAIFGTTLDDRLDGGLGSDSLYGGLGNDTLDTGVGAGGVVDGGEGNNTFVFGRGYGALTRSATVASGALSTDAVRMKSGVSAADLSFSRVGSSLVIRIAGTGDSFTAEAHFAPDGAQAIAQLSLADGSVLTRAAFERLLSVAGTSGNDSLSGGPADDVIDGGNGDDYIWGDEGNDSLYGGSGYDTLDGAGGNDYLDGGAKGGDYESNLLQGGDGDDTLVGGNVMVGGAGRDTYVMTTGGRDTTIREWPSIGPAETDVLLIPAGCTPADIKLGRGYNQSTRGEDDLTITTMTPDSRSTTWTIERYFLTQDNSYKLEEIRFADNTVWQPADILARLPSNLPTAQSDVLKGFRWADTIRGQGGDDWLFGYGADDLLFGDDGDDSLSGDDGNDTLDGGAGRDLLADSSGDDTYVFGRGQGFDRIDDRSGVDRLSLTAGITPADLTLHRIGSDLRLVIDQSPTQLEVIGQFGVGGKGIERIDFADGSYWDAATISSRSIASAANSLTGTPNNDLFVVDNPDDSISEGASQGVDTVQSSISYTLGNNLENLTLTGKLNINANGNELNNMLIGNAASNVFNGADPAWWAPQPFPPPYRLQGADTMVGGGGDDGYWIDGSNQYSEEADDIVVEATGGGNDTVYLFSYHYTLPANVEKLVAQNLNYVRYNIDGFGTETPVPRRLIGSNDANVIDARASEGPIHLDGGAGADTLYGNLYSTYVIDNTGDVIINVDSRFAVDTVRSSISYTLRPGLENLTLTGSAPVNGVGNGEGNILDSSANAAGNLLIGRAGNDLYRLGEGDRAEEIENEGIDTIEVSGPEGTYRLSDHPNIENLVLGEAAGESTGVGTTRAETLTGNNRRNVLEGGDGDDMLLDAPTPVTRYRADDNDSLSGGGGNDRLYSYSGYDTLDGGAGNDSLTIGTSSSREQLWVAAEVHFGRGDGHDRIFSSKPGVRIKMREGVEANQLRFSREDANLLIWINDGKDKIILDSLFLDATSPEIRPIGHSVELVSGQGMSVSHMLLRLNSGNSNDATSGADFLISPGGGARLAAGDGDDTLWGIGSNDALSGGEGNDRLEAGAGDDTLQGDGGSDQLLAGAGNDDVSGGAGDDYIDAGAGANIIRFNRGDGYDILSLGDNDTIVLGAGITEADLGFSIITNPYAPTSGDLLITLSGGTDRLCLSWFVGEQVPVSVRLADGTTLDAAALLERSSGINGTTGSDTLTGTSGNDRIFGLAGNDILYGQGGHDRLDGGPGIDNLQGGAGDDAYWVDNISDQVVEAAGAGTDTVNASVAYTLGNNIEHLTLTGSASIAGRGNNLANTLIGNAGDNLLDGLAGADRMRGGVGNDTYLVESAGDVVEELAGEGLDRVEATVSYSLVSTPHVENLGLSGTTAINGMGNSASNVLTGNAGNNVLSGGVGNDTLNGGAGSDTLLGGAGDDAYLVDTSTDVIIELAGEGVDSVSSSVSYTLAAQLERLSLTGSAAINASGNALANELIGNAGNNVLDGLGGADQMAGGAGNDSYRVDNVADAVIEGIDAGLDTVSSSVTFTLAANVETLSLTGSAAINGSGNELDNLLIGNGGNNALSGGAGNDRLDGGLGSDTLVGGTGDDSYVVNVATDVVTELADQGVDTVNSAVTWTLATHVEKLILTGTSATNGSGNASNNTLTGNGANNRLSGGAGDDLLDGGAGSDTLVGNLGNDSYIVNVTSDVVSELANEGTDTVSASVAWTLGANIENLSLTGTSALNGTGNALDNQLRGNSAANLLTGQAGADLLDGAGGNDSLVGGAAADSYVFGRGWGLDTVVENDATAGVKDRVLLQGSLTAKDLRFARTGNHLEMLITNSTDKLVLQNWYLGSAYRVEEFRFTDGSVLTDMQAQALVGAMAGFGAAGAGTEAPITRRSTIPSMELAPNLVM